MVTLSLLSLNETVKTVAKTTGIVIDVKKLEPNDPAVYEMISRADVVG